jgi:mannose-1-phosphate guanylyltransferase
MLQHTWHRVEMMVPRERVITVVDAGHRAPFREQLKERPAGTIVYQPTNCETAPGTLLPLAHVLREDPYALVAIFPSDHFVEEENRFIGYARVAEWFVRQRLGDVALLGMQPDRPDADYGWIEVRRADRHPKSRVHPKNCVWSVERFWEKPEPLVARELYEAGHLWSTMVIVARAARLWDLVLDAQPKLREPFERIRQVLGTPYEESEVRAVYEKMPSVSLSRDVFERVAPRLAVVEVRGVHWSDWGREERVAETIRRIGSNLAARHSLVNRDERTVSPAQAYKASC